MNKELQKKLKDAGFKRGIDSEPTLTELISACGDGFSTLTRKNGVFMVTSEILFHKNGVAYSEECYGLTPEDAVANLWLHLFLNGQKNNKKQHGKRTRILK